MKGLLLAGLSWALSAGASPRPVVSFDDPTGDADGPGTYVPPTDGELSAQDFDLTRFEVEVDGPDAVFSVTLGRVARGPSVTQRTQYTQLNLDNGIAFQNIDVYLDTTQARGGFSVSIPGRRVTFGEGRTWEKVVVLTPQPELARAATAELGSAADHVIFARPVQVRGKTMVARVPVMALGGPPTRDWGYAVHVSGAAWERDFRLVDRFTGKNVANAYTMAVVTTPERWAFGGAPLGQSHPQVIDLLDGGPVSQHEALGEYAPDAPARVSFVYVRPPVAPALTPVAEARPDAPAAPHTVVDLSGDVVTVAGPTEGLRPMMIGAVLDGGGRPVARVVVVRLLDTGVVASVVDHKERIAPGAGVRFGSPPPAR